MEIQAPKLSRHYTSTDLNSLRLIVQLIPINEGISRWNASKVIDWLEILGQLHHNVGHQLMKLSLKL
jgi:hypothetical protein